MRVCGMVPSLAQALREYMGGDTSVFDPQTIHQAICSKLGGDVDVGLVLSTALVEKDVIGMEASGPYPDVVVILILDPLDIDSKWMTILRSPLSSSDAIFSALYKFDPLA